MTPDFQKKKKKKEIHSKRVIFSTDCSQSMGLQSVLKTIVKTSKLFALQAPSFKGPKSRVNLDAFIFSTCARQMSLSHSRDGACVLWAPLLLLLFKRGSAPEGGIFRG